MTRKFCAGVPIEIGPKYSESWKFLIMIELLPATACERQARIAACSDLVFGRRTCRAKRAPESTAPGRRGSAHSKSGEALCRAPRRSDS